MDKATSKIDVPERARAELSRTIPDFDAQAEKPRHVPAGRDRVLRRDLRPDDYARVALFSLRRGKQVDLAKLTDDPLLQAEIKSQVESMVPHLNAADERRARRAERNRALAAKQNRSAS